MVRIYNEAVRRTVATFDTRPRSLRQQNAWLRCHQGRHAVVVAEDNGRVRGWASLSPWSDRGAYRDTAEISVYVDARFRGRGVGRRLLEAVVRHSRGTGLHVLVSRIAGGNPVSVHLHKALGFRGVGVMREVGWKFNRRIDVQLFELVNPEK